MGSYIDNHGYARRYCDDRLVHRVIAYHEIYLPNREQYAFPFSQYDIHHKNGEKLDNRVENLEILTHEEHFLLHDLQTIDRAISGAKR
jgi:hypothetical protein